MTIDDTRKKWLALIVLCLGDLLIVLDVSIVNVALTSIREDLGFSESSLAWVLNAYTLTFGGFMLLAVFVPALQPWALLLALLSAGGFVALAWATPGHNANLARVAWVDVAAVVFALVGLAAWWLQRGPPAPP
jgi:MFS family permease